MSDVVRISAALSDPSRVRLLWACFGGERCVCQLVELLGLSNATVSKHLSVLRDAGLLVSRKEGRWVHYRLPPEPSEAAREATEWVRRHGEVVRSEDRDRMERILTLEPAELCRMQRAGCCVGDAAAGDGQTPGERPGVQAIERKTP